MADQSKQGQVSVEFPSGAGLTYEQKQQLRDEIHAAVTNVVNKHSATAGKNLVMTTVTKNGNGGTAKK